MDNNATAKTFAEEIDEVIKKNIITYQNDPKRITADYRGEKELTEAYNGRQLLELLQNADDAGTDKVLITLDRLRKTISVANHGVAFDIDGVESLNIAYISPKKNRREFIGNKGLGFRSVLNWVTEVRIKTRQTTLSFSQRIARQKFESIITDVAQRNALIDNEKDLVEGEVPFAVLAMPDVKIDKIATGWTTIIELEYKEEFETRIEAQLAGIQPLIMLFLQNITEIKIAGAGELDKTMNLTKPIIDGEQFLEVNGIHWQLFDSGDLVIDNEAKKKKYYNYKIAWRADLADTNTCLFTYFPTQDQTGLPYLIHGSFDLDPSRNHLNDTPDNEFILGEIASALGRLAVEKVRDSSTDKWLACKFLTPVIPTASGILRGFYEKLAVSKKILPIYPCADGRYRTVNSVKYYNNEFSAWIYQNNYGRVFNDLLLPILDDTIKSDGYIKTNKYENENWHLRVNELSRLIDKVDIRAELISMLQQEIYKPHIKKYALLTNKTGQLISSIDAVAFTPIINVLPGNEFSRPEYLDFEFINDGLYQRLVAANKSSFGEDQASEARRFTEFFREIINVQPYDSNAVIRRIISGTNAKWKTVPNPERPDIMRQMVSSVFKNYMSLKGEKQPKSGNEAFSDSFPLLNRNLEVVEADELFLSNTFPTGKITEELFDGILNNDNYVQDMEYWGLDHEPGLLESFFVWMGVNKYARLKPEKFEITDGDNAYKNYVVGKIKPQFQITYFLFDGLKIDAINDTLGKLTIEKLIVLIKKEERIFNRLSWENPDQFSHKYGNKYFQEFAQKPSFILYQLNKIQKLNNTLIEDYQFPFVNSFSINQHLNFFNKHDVKPEDVQYILSKLGAKNTFMDLGLQSVFTLMNKCAKEKSDNAIARKLYRLAFDNFRKNKDREFDTYHFDLMLLAVKNNIREFKFVDEVYYSDNNTLPAKLIDDYWIFDFPKRSGEKQVAEYFGVKTFKDIKIAIVEGSIKKNKVTSAEFLKWIEKIKPYILTHRINIDNSASIEKTSASALKNVEIELVSEAMYQVNNGAPKKLLPGEFLNPASNKFTICGQFEYNLTALKGEPEFSEAFAEICCVLFEVNEGKDSYRNVFKDSESLKDTIYLIDTKSLNDKLKTAVKLLGLSVEESSFWNAVFNLSGIEPGVYITSREQLSDKLKQNGYQLPNNYSKVDFDTFSNKESFELLKSVSDWSVQVTLKAIHHVFPGFIGLANWNLQQIKNEIISINSLYAKALWAMLKDSDISEQKGFNALKIRFENYCKNLTWDDLDAFVFGLDYKELVINKVQHVTNVALNDTFITEPIGGIYEPLLRRFGIEEERLLPEDQSLLCFDRHEDYFKTIFEDLRKADQAEDETLTNNISSTLTLRFSKAVDGVAPPYKPNEPGKNQSPPNNDHSKRNRMQKKAGKRAELLTRNILKNEHDVIWRSANSDEVGVVKDDRLGYDMEYKRRGTEQWFFLEVKSVSSNSFIISLPEIKKALKEKEKYHLGLVKDNELNIITDFFTDENRLSTFKDLLGHTSVIPTDFEVYVNLNSIVKETDLAEIAEAI